MKPLAVFTKTLRPEARLLLCCGRTQTRDYTAEKMQSLIGAGIDWGYLLSLSRVHNMLPLLYWNLEVHCWQTVPYTVQEQLRNYFSANTRRNLALTGELLRLLELFEAQGIPAIPFRGPTLAALVYGDMALRQFGDLDILVHKRDVLRAKDLLVSRGYGPLFPLPDREEVLFLRWEYPFVSGGGEVFVDLHWGMTRGYFAGVVDPESEWERLERLALAGQPILALSAPDLFVHLCMHGAKHHWGRLDWICDLAHLIHAGREMDWSWIMEQSHRSGSKRMTCLGMFLTHVLFGVEVPEEAQREVRADKRLEPLAEKVYSRLFQKANGRNLLLEEIRFYLRTMDRSRDRIRYCLDRLVKPTPWSVGSLCLPSSLYFLYYFLRPLQLVRQYGFRHSYSESIPK